MCLFNKVMNKNKKTKIIKDKNSQLTKSIESKIDNVDIDLNLLNITFKQLNSNWNADPNAPMPKILIENNDLILMFYDNTHIYNREAVKKIKIIFNNCRQYRLGPPNDEGFYDYNESRFKKYGVKWGEFYLVNNSDWRTNFPDDVIYISDIEENLNHYLFYFRDETFECIAQSYEMSQLNIK